MKTATALPHIVIRASAGTGKTFQLSNRFIELLHRGAAVDRILATTFTRKAAAEILDRVVVRLAEAAIDNKASQQLQSLIGEETAAGLDRNRCAELLRQVLQNLHRLQISTLDSFFGQLAGSMSLELGLPPGWRIVDELEDARLRDAAIARMLNSNSGSDVTRLLHLMAKGEVRRSVAELLRRTVDSLYDVYIETDKAAWSQIPRPAMLASDEVDLLLAKLRRAELPPDKRFEKARASDVQRFTQQQWHEFLEKGLSRPVHQGQTDYHRKPIPAEAIAVYEKLNAHARAMLLHALASQTEATYEMIDRFDQSFQQLKFDTGAIRFEDITRRLADYVSSDVSSDVSNSELVSNDDLRRLEFRLDRRVEHILLDEFQDTSPLQWCVLRPFAHRSVRAGDRRKSLGAAEAVSLSSADISDDRSFFCVGDGKQAIYGWRGGAAEILAAVDTELPELAHQSLTQSFRSSQPVIDAVNEAFTGLNRHPKLDDYDSVVRTWCREFPHHTTARKELEGYVTLRTSPAVEGEDEVPVRLRYAAASIRRLADACPGRSIGVLARRNQVVTQLIFELRQLGIPASEEGGNPLTDSAAVETILSVLRFADHPNHSIAKAHVARSPLGPLVNADKPADSDSNGVSAHHIRRQLVEQGYGRTIREWADELKPYCGERDWRRLQQLMALSHAYETQATLRPTDFVQYVEQQRVSDPVATDVRVMTVHQAKGLQFDTVVLPDLDYDIPGLTPSHVTDRPGPLDPIERVCIYRNQTIQELLPERLRQAFQATRDREMLESLCLLYVAMTRAIHALHMIIAPSPAREKSLRRYASHLLRAALTDGQPAPPETLLYESGSPSWVSSLTLSEADTPHEMVTQSTGAERKLVRKSVIRLAPRTEPRGDLQHVAPSQLEGGAQLPLGQLLRLNHGSAMRRGTLVHAWLEQIDWLEDGIPDDSMLRQVAAPLNTETLEVNEEIEAFRRCLGLPNIHKILCQEYYGQVLSENLRLSVRQEQPIAVRLENQLLTGTIDRLVLVKNGDRPVAADVIDFKTDAIPANDTYRLQSLVQHYSPQIAAYCRAVARAFRMDSASITCRLVFLTAGVVVTVETATSVTKRADGLSYRYDEDHEPTGIHQTSAGQRSSR